jgi:cell division protein FtsQ
MRKKKNAPDEEPNIRDDVSVPATPEEPEADAPAEREDRRRRRQVSDSAPGRPRKKRRKKSILLNIIITILVIVGAYYLASSDIFSISKIEVKSSGSHFAAADIATMSGIKSGDNLWKTRMSKAEERLERDPYIADAKVERHPPGTVGITVKERVENYAVITVDRFAVMDWSGMVLRQSNEAPDLPVVEGVEITRAATGAAIEAARELLLSDVVKLIEDTEKSGLYFSRVKVTDIGVRAYIYDTLSVEGKLESVHDNLDKVKLVVLDLNKQKIRRGTIIVSDSGKCTFSPEDR